MRGMAKTNRGDSSISPMPRCGPNALPKNWILEGDAEHQRIALHSNLNFNWNIRGRLVVFRSHLDKNPRCYVYRPSKFTWFVLLTRGGLDLQFCYY